MATHCSCGRNRGTDPYLSIPVIIKQRLHFFCDLLGKALVKGGLAEESADRLLQVVGVVFGKSGAELVE